MRELRTLSEAQMAKARARRKNGDAWTEIAKSLGCATCTVRRAIDPAYREKRAEQIRQAKRRERSERQRSGRGATHVVSAAAHADIEERLAEIPRDTRDLTALIMGDPIPGDPRCPWRPSAITPAKEAA